MIDVLIKDVFQRLKDFNLVLNQQKCQVRVPEIEFLGYHISREGIRPISSNVEAIWKATAPKSVKELAAFLGTTSYYLKFVSQYATITAPLRQLLKKDAQWEWTEACHNAFLELKSALVSSPVLEHISPIAPILSLVMLLVKH